MWKLSTTIALTALALGCSTSQLARLPTQGPMPDATRADDVHRPQGTRPVEREVTASTRPTCEPCPKGQSCRANPDCVPQFVLCEDFGQCPTEDLTPELASDALLGAPLEPVQDP